MSIGKKTAPYILTLVLIALSPALQAQNNECDEPFEEPDVIVGGLIDSQRYGSSGGITAFSIGTESCNIGSCWANWFGGGSNEHPVIGQNMFRLKDGRFEQIGQSWLKHGFSTLDLNLCSNDCIGTDGQHLGVNCSDPYTSGLNGQQGNLGPKFEVDPSTGTHPHPFTDQGQGGNSIYKRLQVHNDDLDPAQNAGALYWVEGQYVTQDDAAAGNNLNNNSYRRINITGTTNFNIQLTGPTIQELAAIHAWEANDTGVTTKMIEREYVGATKVTDLGNGFWHYEYAIQNLISTRAARAFRVPVPHGAQIVNVGFHDVDYHSGEPYDDKNWEWAVVQQPDGVDYLSWASDTFEENENANALRWGTLYNFRFDANFPPVSGLAFLTPFLPGPPGEPKWSTSVPDRCGDAVCDVDESEAQCPADCADFGDAGEVPDGDLLAGDQLLLTLEEDGDLTLEWGDSCLATDSDYEVYEGVIGNFFSHTSKTCSTGGLTDVTISPVDGDTYYLIVPSNGDREGSYGYQTGPTPRPQGVSACMSQSVGTCQ